MSRSPEPFSAAAEEWERKAQLCLATARAPHFAPDSDVLAIFARRIDGFLEANQRALSALILGATPELVDAVISRGLHAYVVDRSRLMFDASASRRRTSAARIERPIVADWRDMHMIETGQIDLVLGDAALNNVPHESMGEVLCELARVTRPGSLILLRQIVVPDSTVPAYEFANARRLLRAGTIDLNAFDRVLRFYAFNPLALDTSRHTLDARRVFEEIRARFEAGELTGPEFEFLMSRYSEVRHTVYPMAEQLRLLEGLGRCTVDRLPERVFFRELMAIFAIEVPLS